MNLTNIYRTFYLAPTKYAFFSAAHENISKTDHTLGHKQVLKIQKHETIYCISSYHNEIKLEINSKKNYRTYINRRRLINTFLNNH
jgi:hypothetical protein